VKYASPNTERDQRRAGDSHRDHSTLVNVTLPRDHKPVHRLFAQSFDDNAGTSPSEQGAKSTTVFRKTCRVRRLASVAVVKPVGTASRRSRKDESRHSRAANQLPILELDCAGSRTLLYRHYRCDIPERCQLLAFRPTYRPVGVIPSRAANPSGVGQTWFGRGTRRKS